MKSGKVLLGLISGAAAGAIAGLLFAPKRGKDTRKAISDKSDAYLKNANRGINEFTDSLSHKVDALTARTKANLTSSRSKEKVNQAKAEYHDMKAS